MSPNKPADLDVAGPVAKAAHISRQTLNRWVLEGAIRTYGKARTGGRPSRLYSVSEVVELARERGLYEDMREAS